MGLDDDDADDVGGFARPLPPDDRLWRHPSELAALGSRQPTPPAQGRAASWPIAAVAGLVGAALCGGVLAVTGHLDSDERRVVQKVALTPVVSSPLVSDDHSVAVLADQLRGVVATVVVRDGSGSRAASAVVFRGDGLLLTSARSLEGAQSIQVVLADGRRFDSTVVGADLPTDVAVLAIDASDLAVAVLGSPDGVAVGTPVVALAGSERAEEAPVVATGVISALERRLDVAGATLHGLLQTDAPIGIRWSGGPLVDASGAVIGLTTGLAGEGAGFGFATPIDVVRRAADQLLAAGRVTHAWLGIDGTDLSAADAESMGVPGGALVRRVVAGSPAERGGIRAGDVITAVGDHPVSSSSGLVVAMRRQTPGQEVTVAFWREGTRHEARVTCDAQP